MKTIITLALLSCLLIPLYGCSPDSGEIRALVKSALAVIMGKVETIEGDAIGPYSPARRAGNFLFISGQIGLNPKTKNLENESIESETRQALRNMMSILHKAGGDSSDVLSTTIYLKDIDDFSNMNAVYATFFPEGKYPARATVQVAALPKDARVEISGVAYISQNR